MRPIIHEKIYPEVCEDFGIYFHNACDQLAAFYIFADSCTAQSIRKWLQYRDGNESGCGDGRS